MNSVTINAWGNKIIQASRFDTDINKVTGYIPFPFEEDHGSAGVIIRVIELARLREMRPLFSQFRELTGYVAGLPECSTEELALLSTKLTALYEKVNDRKNELQEIISHCERELAQINQGNTEGTGEVIRNKVMRNSDTKERSENQLKATESDYYYVGSVIALFRELGFWDTKGMTLAATLPKPARAATNWPYFSQGCDAAQHIITEMNDVETALNKIISSCTATTAYQKRNAREILRAAASRHYYSVEGESLRNIMSLTDYLSTTLSPVDAALKKEVKMKQLFINPAY